MLTNNVLTVDLIRLVICPNLIDFYMNVSLNCWHKSVVALQFARVLFKVKSLYRLQMTFAISARTIWARYRHGARFDVDAQSYPNGIRCEMGSPDFATDNAGGS